jgi:hypothetical protein
MTTHNDVGMSQVGIEKPIEGVQPHFATFYVEASNFKPINNEWMGSDADVKEEEVESNDSDVKVISKADRRKRNLAKKWLE